ncbi:TadE family type IV pilus minor pilin [Propioniciclava sp.]|uniref:TadE family type IV pilus minor pilin n=1 Tax=Propioniciclava sp. TaxID=2038686 RepID=UPI002604D528|nr:TadE family type IV pilus minor pilin [Propioniciclava sp.]
MRNHGERGLVTVEAAFVSIGVAAAVGAAIGVTGGAFQLAQCQLTANEVARQAARGDDAAVARAKADAPRGARVTIGEQGGVTRVTVALDVGVGPVRVPVEASAQVIDEVRP